MFYGLLIAVPVFMVMWWSSVAAVPPGRAMTMSFLVLSLSQLLHLGNARDTHPVIHPRRVVANRAAIAAVACTIALQIATVLSAMLREALHLSVLGAIDWVVVAGVSVIPAVAGQALKIVSRMRESPRRRKKFPTGCAVSLLNRPISPERIAICRGTDSAPGKVTSYNWTHAERNHPGRRR